MPDYNKIFALSLLGEKHEADAAYAKLCDRGIGIEDVAHRVSGDTWATNWGNYEFTIETCGDSDLSGCAG